MINERDPAWERERRAADAQARAAILRRKKRADRLGYVVSRRMVTIRVPQWMVWHMGYGLSLIADERLSQRRPHISKGLCAMLLWRRSKRAGWQMKRAANELTGMASGRRLPVTNYPTEW